MNYRNTSDGFKYEFESGKLKSPDPNSDNFYLDAARYYYGMYASDFTAFGFGGRHIGTSRRTFAELRNHARGLQDAEKYKDILDPKARKGKNKGRRKLNISWDTVKIIPKFRNIIIDKFESLELIPKTEAVDATARVEKLNAKNRMKLLKLPEMQLLLPPNYKDTGQETSEDIEFLFQMGGVRLAAEIMMKDGIDYVLYYNDYDVIKRMLIEDIIELNAFAVHQETVNGKEKLSYVDPARIIARPSIYVDFRDGDFRGFTEYKNLSEVEMEARLTPDQMKRIAVMDRPYGFAHSDFRSGTGFRDDYGANHTGIEVMTMYFLHSENKRFVTGLHRRGSRQFEEVDANFQLSERGMQEGKKIEEYSILKMHKLKWVVGTDITYDVGEVQNMARDEGHRLLWPLTLFMGKEPSIIERVISFDDDIQIANFKIRSMITKVPPAPRMILYKSMLRDSITIGEENFTMLDMISNFQTEGIFVAEDQGEYSLPGEDVGMRRSPIDFLPSGIMEDMTMLRNEIITAVDNIRQVTGVNEVVDGTHQNKDMLKGVMEGMIQATNSALAPHIRMFVEGFKYMIRHIGYKFQIMVLNGDLKLGAIPVSDSYIKYVELNKELAKYDWGIMVDVDTSENKQLLFQRLYEKGDLLPPGMMFVIWNVILSGDTKKAQFLLAKYTEQGIKEQHQRGIETVQAQAQAQGQAKVAEEQAKTQTLQAQHTLDLKKAEQMFQFDIRKLMEMHRLKMIEMDKKGEIDLEVGRAITKENNANRLNQ